MELVKGQGPMGAEERANTTTLDARGRVLREGDEIILAVRGPLYFRVAQIVPVLDPAAPSDLLHVHVGCMLTFAAKKGVINPEFVRVRTAEEAGPGSFVLLDAKPQPQGSGGA